MVLVIEAAVSRRRIPRADARPVSLTTSQKRKLRLMTSRGEVPARVLRRARILLLLNEGWAPVDVPDAVGAGEATVRRVRSRFEQGGLELALHERPRRGATRVLSQKQEARIVAMVCSDPPFGRARWTVRLVVEQVLKRGIADAVGRETIRILLRDNELKPWREKNVVRQRTQRRVRRADGGRARSLRASAQR